MVTQFITDLERPVSRIRLENYRPQHGSDLEMVVNYFYNLELSEALYPVLQAFEIALRNSIHLTLSQHFNTVYWFDTPHLFPVPKPPGKEPWQQRVIREARSSLSKEGKMHDADRIVAELNFGFWHGILNRPFEAKLWRLNSWQMLREVFPNAPRRLFDRQVAWDQVDRIRILRNRIMHYEPIWYRSQLQQDHAVILQALDWISPAMHQTIAMCDHFPQVHKTGYSTLEEKVQSEIQRRYPDSSHNSDPS